MVTAELLQLTNAFGQLLLGKEKQVRLALSCLLAGGHLLIEDRPGMGKSTLAESLATMFSLAFKRVSFTSDLLPADLTGINVFNQVDSSFHFQQGPLFSQMLLADEINRASPRTQSALLEAMAAGRVSIDGTSHVLPRPFFVIATQNSLDQVGTSPLPEAQLDRFLMRVTLGFPDRDAERQLLRGDWSPVESLQGLDDQTLLQLQQRTSSQYCSEGVLDYVLDIVEASRRGQEGLSPRASQGVVAAARAWALIAGRDHVLIEDVQTVLPSVVEHRLDAGCPSNAGTPLSNDLLERVNALR
ncbi:AAA family ATPase [bacterium]|nr:AAA family ATPase [bacterium]